MHVQDNATHVQAYEERERERKGLKETPQQLLANQLNADGSEVNRQLIRWVKALIQSCAVQMHARAYLSRLCHNL